MLADQWPRGERQRALASHAHAASFAGQSVRCKMMRTNAERRGRLAPERPGTRESPEMVAPNLLEGIGWKAPATWIADGHATANYVQRCGRFVRPYYSIRDRPKCRRSICNRCVCSAAYQNQHKTNMCWCQSWCQACNKPMPKEHMFHESRWKRWH